MSTATLNPTEEKVDLLDRQAFIDQMLLVAETLSKNKKNACYALNGSWGVGKSFVLDMFEQQASLIGQEGTVLNRYLIFRYNCWEYDYYEEPLFAIVASMMDQIEENTNLLSEKSRNRVLGVLKVIGKGVFNKLIRVIEDKSGVPVESVVEIATEGVVEADSEMAEKRSFDEYTTFKDTLTELQKTIRSLAEDQTVLFIVDELDRCLPEYTIKVLERLHHLFDGVPNSQVILSIDKEQIQHAVKQIYGENTSAEKYLAKFIGFELRLDEGIVNDFRYALGAYFKRFDIQYDGIYMRDVDAFITTVLEGVDMRERIAIIDKCHLVHDFICNGEKMDCSIMCLELLLMLLHKCKINTEWAKQGFTITELFAQRYHGTGKYPDEKSVFVELENVPLGLKKLNERYSQNATRSGGAKYMKYHSEDQVTYVGTSNLWGIILCGYRYILGFEEDYWMPGFKQEDSFKEHIKKFWDLMQIIH